MADRKITELSAMSAGGQATGDLLTIVDVSEAAAADKNKKITMENLFKGIPSDVGIGTASPSQLVDCSSGGNAVIRLNSGSTSTTGVMLARGGTEVARVFSDSTDTLKFSTGSSAVERMRIDGSNVGIGTSSPTSRLNVEYGALEAASLHELILNANYGTTNNNGGRIGITFSGHPDGTAGAGSKTAGVYGVSTDNTAFTRSMGLVFNTSTTDANSAERMRLTSDGKLGIGDNSPGHKLVVKDAGATNTSNYLNVISGNAANAGIAFGDTDSDLVGGILYNHSDNALRFFKSGFTEAARIDDSGRLLLGTSSGQSASGHTPSLQVSGTDFSTATVSITNNANSSNGSYLFFCKQRSGSPGGTTALQSGDLIGQLRYIGGDGSDMNSLAATIDVKVDGTPGSNDMPGRIEFATTPDGSSSPTERMRIRANGKINFGQAFDTGSAVSVKGSWGQGIAGGMVFYHNNPITSGRADVIYFSHQGTIVGEIDMDNNDTAYRTTSDHRLKENQVAISDGIERVKQLSPYRFNWISTPAKTVDGFFAHEVQTVVPEAVSGSHNAVDDDNNPVYQGIDQAKLVPLLTAALQEAIAKIETLETKVAALEAQ